MSFSVAYSHRAPNHSLSLYHTDNHTNSISIAQRRQYNARAHTHTNNLRLIPMTMRNATFKFMCFTIFGILRADGTVRINHSKRCQRRYRARPITVARATGPCFHKVWIRKLGAIQDRCQHPLLAFAPVYFGIVEENCPAVDV